MKDTHAPWQRAFYDSAAWKSVREAYKRKVGGLCESCLSKGIIEPGVEVHHVKHLTQENVSDPKVALSFSNLKLLCTECHKSEHRRARRYKVDEHGNVTAKW